MRRVFPAPAANCRAKRVSYAGMRRYPRSMTASRLCLFTIALSISPSADDLRSQQRAWLWQTRSKCFESKCLEERYWDRIGQLAAQINRQALEQVNPAGEAPSHLKVAVELPVKPDGGCQSTSSPIGSRFPLLLEAFGQQAAGQTFGIGPTNA